MPDKPEGILNMKTVDHIAIVVHDARKVARAWEATLGIGPWVFQERGGTSPSGQKIRVLIAYAYTENGVEFELIEPVEGKIFHSEYLDNVGEGLHHIAYAVDDVDGDTKKLVDQGAKVVLGQPGAYSYLRFEGDGGVITELMGKHPPFKDTTG